jgi:rhodanese-related sulfurtransferase
VMGRKSIFKGTIGTAIVKVFDQTVASTGQNEKSLKQKKIPYLKSYTISSSHASYYPGSEMLIIKLIFSPDEGKILGAQIIGKKSADKRIDVIATAIHAKMSVYDLEKLELAYAPPYSSAKDPINIAGFAASNILKKDISIIHWHELSGLDLNKHILVDLRTNIEIKKLGTIEGSIHIPLDELRNNLNKLDKEKTYILFCAIGLRGYIGNRILSQNGFKVKNLSGGYSIYQYAIKNYL